MGINWEVVLWTCITIAVLMGIFATILYIISAVNMKKRRKDMVDIHTTLAIGSKVMFAGGIYGKVVRLGEGEIIGVEVAPKTIIDGTGMVAMPGFVNCHTHLATTALRSYCDDLSAHEALDALLKKESRNYKDGRKNGTITGKETVDVAH